MIKVPHMNQIGLNLIQYLRKALINTRGPVAILQSRVVYEVDGNPGVVRVPFCPQPEVRRKGIFFPGEDMYFVTFSKPMTKCLTIDF
jgi:hypothetical protein